MMDNRHHFTDDELIELAATVMMLAFDMAQHGELPERLSDAYATRLDGFGVTAGLQMQIMDRLLDSLHDTDND